MGGVGCEWVGLGVSGRGWVEWEGLGEWKTIVVVLVLLIWWHDKVTV